MQSYCVLLLWIFQDPPLYPINGLGSSFIVMSLPTYLSSTNFPDSVQPFLYYLIPIPFSLSFLNYP